ncbi:MAG: DNA primase [Clostridia bacterium]|nr:DNA primase [Clostridia bacterium]
MAFIDENLLDEIKSSNDIVDIVSEYVTLKRTGTSYKGLCPFHKEKTPSFSVSSDKQIFHCFGCGVGGDVIRFVQQVENIDFMEAVEMLAERAKITLPEKSDNMDLERVHFKECLFQINLETAKYFRSNLASENAKAAREYMQKRKLDTNTVNRFGLGFAFGNNNDLFQHLKSLGFTPSDMVAAGVVIQNENSYVDRFRQRLMFPIFDVKDRVIAFGGRVLDDSLPKYMNSPETPIYSKSKTVYALNFARKAKVNQLLMVEGYMDVISLHKAGIPQAVASLGTALTESQGRLMRKYAPEIILGYDADGAGQAAILRGLDILAAIGCNVKVMKISGAKDPDEFVNKYGPDKLLHCMEHAMTLVEFKLENLKKTANLTTTDGKISFLNSSAAILAKIDNSIERELYSNKIASDVGIGVEAIYSEINKRIFGNSNIKVAKNVREKITKAEKEAESREVPEHVYHAEKLLIFLLCQNEKKNYEMIKKYISTENFRVNLYRKYAEKLYEHFEQNQKQNVIDLFTESEDINVITGIMQEDFNFGNNNEKALSDAVNVIRKFDLESEKAEILKEIKNAANNEEIEGLERRLSEVILKLHSLTAERRK